MTSVGINETVVGTCGLCGGPVTVPRTFHSIVLPTPTCKNCGATKRAHGPVLDMEPPRSQACPHGQVMDRSRPRGSHHGTCSCCGVPTDDVNCTEEGACWKCGTRRLS